MTNLGRNFEALAASLVSTLASTEEILEDENSSPVQVVVA